MKIITCAQMKAAERFAIENGTPALRLMDNAGTTAAAWISRHTQVHGAHCTVVCGAGNNGGDGFVVARRLCEAGAAVCVVLAGGAPRTSDAKTMLEALKRPGVRVFDYAADTESARHTLQKCTFLVDAVFGTGFHGEVEARYAGLFDAMNQAGCPIFALDMPSGSNADTGRSAAHAVRATATVTFGAAKCGQLVSPAREHCGELTAVEIGIPPEAFPKEAEELPDLALMRKILPRRDPESNKGSYGRLLCLVGSLRYPGAAYMAGTAAARCGAGLVTVGMPRSARPLLAARMSEVMTLALPETTDGSLSLSALDEILSFAEKCSAVLIGCGLTTNGETQALVRLLLSQLHGPVILDADGINACAGHIDVLRTSKAERILTPHPGEMARLTGKTIAEVQSNRAALAAGFARENGLTLVLKGAGTLIAAPDGRIWHNNTGNPGLAKGGSGDILAGMTAGLAAQKIEPPLAACAAVYLHGLAADRVAAKRSQYGMLPTDLFGEIPQIFCELSR